LREFPICSTLLTIINSNSKQSQLMKQLKLAKKASSSMRNHCGKVKDK
jgi:hypothetical protein